MKNILLKLAPFIFLGVMLVLLAIGIILFSYLLILGALAGCVLFMIAQIKEKFFSARKIKSSSKSGRIIDHDHPRR